MPGDKRRRAAGGRLRSDHPEGLREDGRRHAHVCERPEVREVAVLERAREEDAAAAAGLELGPSRPEADDHRARPDTPSASSRSGLPSPESLPT